MSTTTQRKVLLLSQGTETLETSAFIDEMGWADDQDSTPISVITAAASLAPVVCTFGVRIQ